MHAHNIVYNFLISHIWLQIMSKMRNFYAFQFLIFMVFQWISFKQHALTEMLVNQVFHYYIK